MSTSVTFEKATRIYPGTEKPAVDALDLEIAEGEFLVLVGPSGCGKSTSLRMLAGLEDVTSGRILIGDRDVTHLRPKDRDIAMVFQNYALYPHMSVGENMGFALKIAGVNKADIDAGCSRRPRSSTSSRTSTASPRRSPAASASASRWAGPSCASRRCSAWTSRCPTSTPSCASPPAPRSPRSSAGSTPPPSTSPTTRSRR